MIILTGYERNDKPIIPSSFETEQVRRKHFNLYDWKNTFILITQKPVGEENKKALDHLTDKIKSPILN